MSQIRFLSDWQYYPTAGVHVSTKNKSFVNLAALYKKMGVKNYYFLLAIKNPAIAHLDPHDEHLTEDEKLAISVECKLNVWYYLREVCRIPPTTGNSPVVFRANRGNIALIWCFLCNVDVALIQPRQTGKSVSTDSLMTWLLFFSLNNTTVGLITKDHTLRVANIERLKKLRDLIPPYLIYIDKLDSNNQMEITYKALTNKYMTSVAQNSETLANNVGRGNSVPILHCDEGPFINLIGTTLPAALAAGTAAREEAELNRQPYGNIFTTTAGKKDDRDGRYMYDMITGGAPWTERFLDCESRTQLHDWVMKNCPRKKDGGISKLLINCTFNHRQLGFSDEWLYKAISNAGGTQEQIDRDFFNVWTSGTQRSPLSIKLNEAIKKSEIEPQWVEFSKDGYMLRWYIPEARLEAEMARGYYVMGIDPSEAVGRDDIALVIVDLRDMSVVASGNYNETNIIAFSNYVTDLMVKYPRVTLVIERKSTGSSILAWLMLTLPPKGVDPFRRIFNTVVEAKYDDTETFRSIMQDVGRRTPQWYDKFIRKFGFNTTAESRGVLFLQVLPEAAKRAGHRVRDRMLSDQIRGLVVKRGRIDHSNDSHDDMVVAWLLCHWFASHARFHDFYGIEPRAVMSQCTNDQVTVDPVARKQKLEQQSIKERIESISDRLALATDQMSISRLEHDLRSAHASMKDFGELPQSYNEMLAQISERRRMNVRQQASKFGSSRQMQKIAKPVWGDSEAITYFG